MSKTLMPIDPKAARSTGSVCRGGAGASLVNHVEEAPCHIQIETFPFQIFACNPRLLALIYPRSCLQRLLAPTHPLAQTLLNL
jgi:hypothetical protein